MGKIENQIRYLEQEGMPVALDCERAILGAILLDNRTFFQTATLTAEDFSLDSHRKIFRHISALAEEGQGIDFQTLTLRLSDHRELEGVGGVVYVTNLTDGLPRVKNIEQYVKAVRDKARARTLLALCQTSSAKIQEQEPADEVLAEIQDQIIKLVHHGRAGRVPDIAEIATEFLEEIHHIRSMDDACVGISTGLDDLDSVTTGFRPSEFYVFGARPGDGKTALMCQALRENCKAGRKCSAFSVEVKRTQIMQRLVAQESGISVFDMRDPRILTEGEMMRVTIAAAEVAKWPLLLEDSPRLDVKQLQAIARLHISQGAQVIFVDFLQKLRATGRDRFEKVTAIADGLWELARSTDVPVVALSQLRRRQSPHEEPTMDDLRESGEIEQNAHAVFLLHRPTEVVDDKRRHTGLDKIIIAKQRSGPAGTFVPVRFNGKLGMFEQRMVSANG
jgi:replicative DNA helicase